MKGLAEVVAVVLLLALVFMVFSGTQSSSQSIEQATTKTAGIGVGAIGLFVLFLITAAMVIGVFKK